MFRGWDLIAIQVDCIGKERHLDLSLLVDYCSVEDLSDKTWSLNIGEDDHSFGDVPSYFFLDQFGP